MKLGTTTIKRIGIGSANVRGGYVGALGLGSLPDGPTYPLYDEVGDWATSSLAATVYTPNLVAPVHDVLDYGADPTGATNSTEAFRDAMAAVVTAGGGTVYMPAGTYVLFPDAEGEHTINIPSCTNLRFVGDGPTETILNFRAWGGQDPADLIEFRGFAFYGDESTTVNGLVFQGFRGTGNAPVTSNAGVLGGPGTFDGWDTQHKGVGIFNNKTGVLIEDCEWDNWRGEILYAGGSNLGTMTIRRCVVRGANASAISMGGTILVEDSEIYGSLNATENFNIGTETSTIRNCIIEPNRGMPDGLVEGVFGLVHHGISTTSLLVEDCTFRGGNTAAVFLAEMAHNVTIQNNIFEDVNAGVYAIYLAQYVGVPAVPNEELNRFENINILGNTFHAKTSNCGVAIQSYTTPWVDTLIDGNEVIRTGSFNWNQFIWTRGSTGDYIVSNNVIDVGNPAIYQTEGPRATAWTNNTVSGDFSGGALYASYLPASDPTPISINPAWPMVNVSAIGGTDTMQRELTIDQPAVQFFPTGFPVQIVRGGSTVGAEIKPDLDWNNLARGYMLYSGADLDLAMAAGGLFELVGYTPPTVNLRTHTESLGGERASAADIAFFGQLEVTLSPSVAHTFSTFSGVAIGETVDINYNANVTIEHTPGVIETVGGTDFVAGGSGTLSAIRALDGTLLLGDHSATNGAPRLGLALAGDWDAGVHDVNVTLIQDGSHPAPAGGYYSIERKLAGGSFAEIAQVVKGDFTGTPASYVYLDDTTIGSETYLYRARAVSPGTPDTYSRYSNTDTEITKLTGPTAVSGTSSLLSATIAEAGTTIYWYVSIRATPPDNITSSADSSAYYTSTSTAGANTQATSLGSGTYYLHVAHFDGINYSSTTTSAAFVVT